MLLKLAFSAQRKRFHEMSATVNCYQMNVRDICKDIDKLNEFYKYLQKESKYAGVPIGVKFSFGCLNSEKVLLISKVQSMFHSFFNTKLSNNYWLLAR